MDLVIRSGYERFNVTEAFESLKIKVDADQIFPSVELYFNSIEDLGGFKTVNSLKQPIYLDVSFSLLTGVTFVCSNLNKVIKNGKYHYQFIGYVEEYNKAISKTTYFNIYQVDSLSLFLNRIFLTMPCPDNHVSQTVVLLGLKTIKEGLEKLKEVFSVFYFKPLFSEYFIVLDKKSFGTSPGSFANVKKVAVLDYKGSALNAEMFMSEYQLKSNQYVQYNQYDILTDVSIPVIVDIPLVVDGVNQYIFEDYHFNPAEFHTLSYKNNVEKDIYTIKVMLDTELQVGDVVVIYDKIYVFLVMGATHHINADDSESYTEIKGRYVDANLFR